MTKSLLREVQAGDLRYQALMFWCPGCETVDDEGGLHGGLHMLPVSGDSGTKSSWTFNGDLIRPTIEPSILTRFGDVFVCHSYLRDGVFEFLSDCTHVLAGKKVGIPDLPEWVLDD